MVVCLLTPSLYKFICIIELNSSFWHHSFDYSKKRGEEKTEIHFPFSFFHVEEQQKSPSALLTSRLTNNHIEDPPQESPNDSLMINQFGLIRINSLIHLEEFLQGVFHNRSD